MVNKARTTLFDIPTYGFAGVSDQTTIGFAKFSVRENAPNPRYVAIITDQGELFLFDKDGTKIYGPVGSFAGHGSPDELSVNQNRLVCIRSGTSLALINSDGTLRWNFTGGSAIANLVAAKLGTLYVCCFINTGTAATSGVQWRSLVDGSIVQGVYGTAVNSYVTNPASGIAVGQTGERAAIGYIISTNNYLRVEHHQIVAGRLWSWVSVIQVILAAPHPIKIAVDKDCGYTIAAQKNDVEGTATPAGANDICVVLDNLGNLLGTPWGSLQTLTFFGVCMSPDGRQAGSYADSVGPLYNLYKVMVVPYASTTTGLAGKGKGLDITDDDVYYAVGCEDGKIYVYRVDGYPMGNTAYGGTATPIATVRNYT